MSTNIETIMALLIASSAIAAVMVALYRNGALSFKGMVVVATLLSVITVFLASTL